MGKDTIVKIKKPDGIRNLLTEMLREGARKLLASAVKNSIP